MLAMQILRSANAWLTAAAGTTLSLSLSLYTATTPHTTTAATTPRSQGLSCKHFITLKRTCPPQSVHILIK